MDKLNLYYKNQFESVLVNISKAKDLGEDNIHRLRVDIKKIRSLLLLLDVMELESETVSKLLKQLRSIYKYCGKLRMIQVNVNMTNELSQKQTKVIQLLEADKAEVSAKLSETLEKFNNDKFQKRMERILSTLNGISESDMRVSSDKLIHDELNLIYKLWTIARGEENYHEIRKFLKVIKSLLQLLLELGKTDDLVREYDVINRTESVVGDWHDRDVLDKTLNDIQRSSDNGDFKSKIRQLRNKNKSEKNTLAKDFKQLMIDHFMKS